jgi:hypothetical protein
MDFTTEPERVTEERASHPECNFSSEQVFSSSYVNGQRSASTTRRYWKACPHRPRELIYDETTTQTGERAGSAITDALPSQPPLPLPFPSLPQANDLLRGALDAFFGKNFPGIGFSDQLPDAESSSDEDSGRSRTWHWQWQWPPAQRDNNGGGVMPGKSEPSRRPGAGGNSIEI